MLLLWISCGQQIGKFEKQKLLGLDNTWLFSLIDYREIAT